jgi:hypothetical protein
MVGEWRDELFILRQTLIRAGQSAGARTRKEYKLARIHSIASGGFGFDRALHD